MKGLIIGIAVELLAAAGFTVSANTGYYISTEQNGNTVQTEVIADGAKLSAMEFIVELPDNIEIDDFYTVSSSAYNPENGHFAWAGIQAPEDGTVMYSVTFTVEDGYKGNLTITPVEGYEDDMPETLTADITVKDSETDENRSTEESSEESESSDSDTSADNSEPAEDSESTEITDDSEMADTGETTDTSEAVETSEASNASEVADTGETADNSESSDTSEVVDTSEATDTSEVTDTDEAVDTSEATDTSEVAGIGGMVDTSEAIDASEAADTISEPDEKTNIGIAIICAAVGIAGAAIFVFAKRRKSK